MRKVLIVCLLLLRDQTLASGRIPLPLEGLYESRGSLAKERIREGRWRDIP